MKNIILIYYIIFFIGVCIYIFDEVNIIKDYKRKFLREKKKKNCIY